VGEGADQRRLGKNGCISMPVLSIMR